MCMFSKPKAPPPVQIPTADPVPSTPDPGTSAAQNAAQEDRKRRLASQAGDTMVTGGAGLAAPANTANKTLYGQ
jgi:hypothetical protein